MAIWHAPFNGEQLKCKEPKFSKNATSTCLDTISDFRKKNFKVSEKTERFCALFLGQQARGEKKDGEKGSI
jgi:hypothetical protein